MKTVTGKSFVQEDSSLWRITGNIPGVKIAASDPRTYAALINALNLLHNVFKSIPPSSAVISTGVLDTLENMGNSDLNNHPFVIKAFDWLLPQIFRIQKNKTITHGDFNPTNIIYKIDGESLAVIGVLDFELCRPDPAIMDYSQLFSMVVCHSGFSDQKRETDNIVARLEGRFSHEELRLATLAYWIDLYSKWYKVSEAVEEKMRLRITQVWNFIQLYS